VILKPREMCLRNLFGNFHKGNFLGKYYSQHGEDALLDLIFKDQKDGFFVEVGCIDGKCFSNTLTFEERGWKGMCVEAHAGYIELLKRNRPNSIICHCAAGEADEDAIFYANARGSLSTLDKTKEENFQQNYGSYFSGFEEQNVRKARLSSLLDKYQISEIDILSLDIEGYEVEALKGLDILRHRPKVLVIESDSRQHEALLDEMILPHGYTKSVKLSVNQYYVSDKELDKALRGRKFTVRITHTQHPLDAEGDKELTVTLDTTGRVLSSTSIGQGFQLSPVVAKIKNLLRHFARKIRALSNRKPASVPNRSYASSSIDDPDVIKTFTDNPNFPYLVSFSRTGSHWLRMIMELYFEKPSLVRAFYFKNANHFTCYHTHDMDMKLKRENVIYLYRDPVETVYSQLSYYKEDPNNEERRRHWTNLYARHLAKWLVYEDFTKKKTVITYERMKVDMYGEIKKICEHFNEDFDPKRLSSVLAQVSKNELKKKTEHDQQVVNLSTDYEVCRAAFTDKYSKQIVSEIYALEPELERYFLK
jgi:FkbM family methyltransferase